MANDLPPGLEAAIKRLHEHELRHLNRIIVERLKLLSKAKQLKSMAKFCPGDQAYFHHDGEKIQGTVFRCNRTTITLLVDDGHQWNIAPSLLIKFMTPPSHAITAIS